MKSGYQNLHPPESGVALKKIGRYEVMQVIGRGGMGEVCKALDTANSRVVALKTLDAEPARDAEVLRRFQREARSAVILDHPNIARIYGLEYDAQRKPFIVMAYVEGDPLDLFLCENRDLLYSELLGFAVQVARGLESAHRRSIIHRDIKPSNLIVTPEHNVVIIDFGLAKSMWDQSVVTGSNTAVGTPRYISPEQAMGRVADHRSDIYSLGATCYEMFTRQAPFDGATPMEIMLKHVNTPVLPPHLLNPKIPGDVNEIIMRMLEKEPGDRYQDYESLIRDLESAKIHRLAKERRMVIEAEAPQSVPGGSAIESGVGASTPVSDYVKEGIVRIDPSEIPDGEIPATEWSRRVLVWGAGVMIIAAITAYLLTGKSRPEAQKPWLVRAIGRLTAPSPTEVRFHTTPEALVALDQQNIQTTRERMESILVKALEYRRASPDRTKTPKVQDLVEAGIVEPGQASDAWGNPIVISSASGGMIIAAGRDSVEGTHDDFVYSLNGAAMRIPSAKTFADFEDASEVE